MVVAGAGFLLARGTDTQAAKPSPSVEITDAPIADASPRAPLQTVSLTVRRQAIGGICPPSERSDTGHGSCIRSATGSWIDSEVSEVRNSDDCFSWGFGSNAVAVADEAGNALASASFGDWGVKSQLDSNMSATLMNAFNPEGVLVCVWEVTLSFETSAQTLKVSIDATPDGWEHPIWGYPGASCDALEPNACYQGYATTWTVQELEQEGWLVDICDAPDGASSLAPLCGEDSDAATSSDDDPERIVDASCGEEHCAGVWKTSDGVIVFEAWGMGNYFGVITVCVEKTTRACRTMSPQEMTTGDFEWRLPWAENFPLEGSGTYRVTMTSEYGDPVGDGSWDFEWNASAAT